MKKLLLLTASSAAVAAAVAMVAKTKLNAHDNVKALSQSKRKILVVGATSAIAQETCKRFAANGDDLFLAARNQDKLDAIIADLKVRGASNIYSFTLDVNDLTAHPTLLQQATEALGGLDTVLIAHGTLGNQEAGQQSFELTRQELETNFLSVVSLLTPLANQFEAQGYGTIAVISSVAGDRGRGSNYIYGTAKAGVSTFLQGLRNRLSKKGVTVITIKPGFVDTPMTAHIANKGPLFVGPAVIADGIYTAIQKQKDVVYLPWFWQGIMLVIRHIPESIFKRLSL